MTESRARPRTPAGATSARRFRGDRADGSTGRWALGAFAVVLVAVALLKMGPWLMVVVRPTSSVPGPDPLATVSPIRLEPGRSACVKDVAFDTDSRVAQVVVRPVRGRAGALRVVADGPGYRAAGSTQPATGVRAVVTATIAPPPRSLIGRVCVVNPTRRPVVLEGSAEDRTDTRQVTEVAGRPAPGLSLQLLRGGVQRRVRETPLLLHRAAEYKAGFLRGWMLWPLALIVVVGVPAAALYALLAGMRSSTTTER